MSARRADPAKSRIVLIGTPTYHDPRLPDIPVIGRNVADLAQALTDPGLGGFDAASCLVAAPDAGLSEVGDLLLRAASEAEDLLLVYYCGHGLLGPRRGELYLSLAGTRPDRLAFTALSFDAVRDACLDSRAKIRIVILDSCFSGRAIGQALAADEVLGQVEVAGTYTLCAAPANRTAQVMPGEEHTAFTERLLQLLWTGIATAGPLLTMADIYHHLLTRLRSEGLPEPQQRGTETAGLLALSRNRGYAPPLEKEHPAAEPETVPEPQQHTAVITDLLLSVSGNPVGHALPLESEHRPEPAAPTRADARHAAAEPSFALWDTAEIPRITASVPESPAFEIARKGYDVSQVNAYFSRPPDTRSPFPRFELVRRGYAKDQVDRHVARSAHLGDPIRLKLPQLVPYASLPGPAERQPFTVPLGLRENVLEPVFLDFKQESHFLVFGEVGSGKTSALRTLVKGITEMCTGDQARILMVDYRRTLFGALPESHALSYCASSEAVSATLAEISPFLNERLSGPDVTPEQLRIRSWRTGPEIFVIVDDYDLVTARGGNSLDLLAEYLPAAQKLGLHLIVARASHTLYDPLLQTMRDHRQPTLLLSGEPMDGPLIDFAPVNRQFPGRGTLVSAHLGTVRLQTAFTPSSA